MTKFIDLLSLIVHVSGPVTLWNAVSSNPQSTRVGRDCEILLINILWNFFLKANCLKDCAVVNISIHESGMLRITVKYFSSQNGQKCLNENHVRNFSSPLP